MGIANFMAFILIFLLYEFMAAGSAGGKRQIPVTRHATRVASTACENFPAAIGPTVNFTEQISSSECDLFLPDDFQMPGTRVFDGL
jgi:hypothetical protein